MGSLTCCLFLTIVLQPTLDCYSYLYGTSTCSYCGYVSGRSYIPTSIGTIEAPTYSSSVSTYSIQVPSVTHEYIVQTAPRTDPVYVDLPPIHVYPQKTVQYVPTYEVQYKPVVQQTYVPQTIKTYTAFREDQALADAIALARYGRNIVSEDAFRQNSAPYEAGKDKFENLGRPTRPHGEELESRSREEIFPASSRSQPETNSQGFISEDRKEKPKEDVFSALGSDKSFSKQEPKRGREEDIFAAFGSDKGSKKSEEPKPTGRDLTMSQLEEGTKESTDMESTPINPDKTLAKVSQTDSSEELKTAVQSPCIYYNRYCSCHDCFKQWWSELTPVMKNRISHWQYYIDLHNQTHVRRARSEAVLGADSNKPSDGVEVCMPVINDWKGYGERLYDDSIDIYCDRMQRAARAENKTIEGCFAIQFVYGNMDDFANLITGNNMVLQVIFDESRTGHFLMLEWTPHEKMVVVYDSLIPTDYEACQTLTLPVKRQIRTLFGHLYPEAIPVRLERHLEAQEDDWSCGLRVIGFLTRRALDRPAAGQKYVLNTIGELIDSILANPNPKLTDFLMDFTCPLNEFRESIFTVLDRED